MEEITEQLVASELIADVEVFKESVLERRRGCLCASACDMSRLADRYLAFSSGPALSPFRFYIRHSG